MQRHCSVCWSFETYRTKGKQQWYTKDNITYCKKCYNKRFTNPRWNRIANSKYPITKAESNRRYNPRHYKYARKYLVGWARQLTGYCSRCVNNVYDESCKLTSMHHWVYIVIFPWFGREELCNSCHQKETWRLGQILLKPNVR
jgi:hypothetical protein